MRWIELRYKEDLFDYMSELIDIIERNKFSKGIVIDVNDISVEQGVKNACKYCTSFKKNYSCPPYSPKIERTVKIISEYNSGILLVLRINIPTFLMKLPIISTFLKNKYILKNNRKMHRMILKLENLSTRDGFKTYGFIAGKCMISSRCITPKRRKCSLPKLKRYSLESMGINVYKLAKLYGIKLDYKLKDVFYYIGLLLIKKLNEQEKVIPIIELELDDNYPIEITCLQDLYEKMCVEQLQKKLKMKYGHGKLYIASNKDNSGDGIGLNKFIETMKENNYEVITYGYINSLKKRSNFLNFFLKKLIKIRLKFESLLESETNSKKVYILAKKENE